jgi:hypothetical protein
MSRWARLWKAIKDWWRNEPPPLVNSSDYLSIASKALSQYDDIYCRRLKIPPGLSGQTAEIVMREGHQRPATIESEVRVLAITVERLLRHLQTDEVERQNARMAERRTYPMNARMDAWKKRPR